MAEIAQICHRMQRNHPDAGIETFTEQFVSMALKTDEYVKSNNYTREDKWRAKFDKRLEGFSEKYGKK